MTDETDTPSEKEPALDLEEIRQIVDLMAKNDLSFLNLEVGAFKIKLRRGSDMEAARDFLASMPRATAAPAMSAATTAPAPATAPVGGGPQPAAPEPAGATINSPMVGTFYRSPSPGEKAFVSAGDVVDENTTVC